MYQNLKVDYYSAPYPGAVPLEPYDNPISAPEPSSPGPTSPFSYYLTKALELGVDIYKIQQSSKQQEPKPTNATASPAPYDYTKQGFFTLPTQLPQASTMSSGLSMPLLAAGAIIIIVIVMMISRH